MTYLKSQYKLNLLKATDICEDGNSVNGDGCNYNCIVEKGWVCSNYLDSLHVCRKLCGDGVKQTGETCDDGNSVTGDGCTSSCQVESGWTCLTPGVRCTKNPSLCGNGRLDPGE